MFSDIKKQHLIVFLLMLSLLFGAGVRYGKYLARNSLPPVSVGQVPDQEKNPDKQPHQPAGVTVHVTGAVKNPGVFTLEEGKRVIDAVNLAEPLADADLNGINLAKKLADQEKISVPCKESGAGPASNSGTRNNTSQAQSTASGQLININTASETELDALPGIGPSKARAIVQYREENGSFSSIEDIQNVSGIGPATFDKLKDQITVY